MSFLKIKVALAFVVLAGCMSVSTPEELARFEQAGPYTPQVDMDAVFSAKRTPGPYRVGPGDILEFDMPEVYKALLPGNTTRPIEIKPHICRVTTTGMITLPMIGEIEADQKTLGELESVAVKAYYPKYLVHRPSIVAMVKEYSTVKVTVTGAVKQPGIYDLTREEMSLVGALMKAGGILSMRAGGVRGSIPEGASTVIIHKPGKKGEGETIVLPVRGLNIVFVDAALEGGETIEVLRLNTEVFTVLGLVRNPGTYEYPPGNRYSLLHAIGFGGGLDIDSAPSYIQVFRQDAGGEIVSATFDLSGDGFQNAASVAIKQGDIVAVVDTARTQFSRIINNAIKRGVYVGYQLNNN